MMTNKELLEKCLNKNLYFTINNSKKLSVKKNRDNILGHEIIEVNHNQDGSCIFILAGMGVNQSFKFEKGVKNYEKFKFTNKNV